MLELFGELRGRQKEDFFAEKMYNNGQGVNIRYLYQYITKYVCIIASYDSLVLAIVLSSTTGSGSTGAYDA